MACRIALHSTAEIEAVGYSGKRSHLSAQIRHGICNIIIRSTRPALYDPRSWISLQDRHHGFHSFFFSPFSGSVDCRRCDRPTGQETVRFNRFNHF